MLKQKKKQQPQKVLLWHKIDRTTMPSLQIAIVYTFSAFSGQLVFLCIVPVKENFLLTELNVKGKVCSGDFEPLSS